jgi:hypothetical protein
MFKNDVTRGSKNGRKIAKASKSRLSEIVPWRDTAHRHYLYAEDKERNVCALVVLAQLAPRYGVQVKWALDFPNAPNGAIEYATLVAMDAAKADWEWKANVRRGNS